MAEKDKKDDKKEEKREEDKSQAQSQGAVGGSGASASAASAGEKEEFRAYLKRSGIIDTLTKILTQLYDSAARPEDTNQFLKEHLGPLVNVDIVKLERENKELREKLEAAEKKLKKQ